MYVSLLIKQLEMLEKKMLEKERRYVVRLKELRELRDW